MCISSHFGFGSTLEGIFLFVFHLFFLRQLPQLERACGRMWKQCNGQHPSAKQFCDFTHTHGSTNTNTLCAQLPIFPHLF